MCPHEILTVKGYALEDYWGTEWEKRYLTASMTRASKKRSVTVKDIVRLVLCSAVETGTLFRLQPRQRKSYEPKRPHTGMTIIVHLCTEIAQNMAPIEHISTEAIHENGDTVVVTATLPGELVVCNLASLSLGNLAVEDILMERTVETTIRALDNVTTSTSTVEYARLTNQKYRSIGLGVSGYHHMLAKRGIRWRAMSTLPHRCGIRAYHTPPSRRTALAREKRPLCFEGSDRQTGAYFEKRGYTRKVAGACGNGGGAGMRNAYLLAVAPTSSIQSSPARRRASIQL